MLQGENASDGFSETGDSKVQPPRNGSDGSCVDTLVNRTEVPRVVSADVDGGSGVIAAEELSVTVKDERESGELSEAERISADDEPGFDVHNSCPILSGQTNLGVREGFTTLKLGSDDNIRQQWLYRLLCHIQRCLDFCRNSTQTPTDTHRPNTRYPTP